MNTEIPIREIMTTDLVTIGKKVTVEEIKQKFKIYKFHHLLVTGKENQLAGIISKGDFYRFIYNLSTQTTGKTWSKKKMQSVRAKDLMTRTPYVLDPEDTIRLAADMLLSNKFHAIPVVEAGEVVGIVTTFDLLAYSFNKQIEHIAGVMN